VNIIWIVQLMDTQVDASRKRCGILTRRSCGRELDDGKSGLFSTPSAMMMINHSLFSYVGRALKRVVLRILAIYLQSYAFSIFSFRL
jgi:hypothetical protein